jgi:periplasmic protein TonB
VSGLRLPLAVSLAGHAVGLILLVWLSARLPPLVLMPPAPPNAVAVIFEAPPAPPQPAPTPPPPAKVEPPPPPPPPPPKPVEVPKPVVIEQPPKPKPPPRHIVRRRIERPVEQPVEQPPTPPVEAPQTASLPPAYRPPTPLVSLDYRNALAAWFAAHKHYPEGARDRGEEGVGLLRFRVDRSGRVLSYALVQSTGHADLDGAIEAMMQGAVLPPFPADMAASDIEVTMPFAFRLEQ